MSERLELASCITEAAAMLDYAEESFEKLATLTEAIHALAGQPEIGRKLTCIAHDMAEALASTFGERKNEYTNEYRRVPDAEQSSRGRA